MDASEGELGNFNAKCQEMFQTALDARGDEEAKIVKLKAQAKDAFDAVKERFAIVPTDKTPQTLTIVCKRFYSTLVDKHLNAAYYEPADEEALAEAMATFKEASPGKQTNRVAQYVYLTMKMHKDDQANPHKAYVRMVAGTSSGDPKLNYTTAASAELAAALRGVLSSIKHLDILKCRGNSEHRDERYHVGDGVRRTMVIQQTNEVRLVAVQLDGVVHVSLAVAVTSCFASCNGGAKLGGFFGIECLPTL